MSEPLSPERLAEIRERVIARRTNGTLVGTLRAVADSAADVPALLAEVERLRAQLAEITRFASEWEANAEALALSDESEPSVPPGFADALSVCALAVRTVLAGGTP